MVGSSPLLASAFCGACIFGQLFELGQAQNRTQAATDPAEGVPLSLSHTHTVYYILMLLADQSFFCLLHMLHMNSHTKHFFFFFCILDYNPINKQ